MFVANQELYMDLNDVHSSTISGGSSWFDNREHGITTEDRLL